MGNHEETPLIEGRWQIASRAAISQSIPLLWVLDTLIGGVVLYSNWEKLNFFGAAFFLVAMSGLLVVFLRFLSTQKSDAGARPPRRARVGFYYAFLLSGLFILAMGYVLKGR